MSPSICLRRDQQSCLQMTQRPSRFQKEALRNSFSEERSQENGRALVQGGQVPVEGSLRSSPKLRWPSEPVGRAGGLPRFDRRQQAVQSIHVACLSD